MFSTPRSLALAFVLFALTLSAQSADACQTVYWVKQGQHEAYYNYGQVVQLRPGGQAILRVYWAGQGRGSVLTTTTSIGHPWDYNQNGYDRRETSRVVVTQAQNNKQYSIGKINLKPQSPGTTLLGYRIDGVGRGNTRVPNQCLTDTVTIQVVP